MIFLDSFDDNRALALFTKKLGYGRGQCYVTTLFEYLEKVAVVVRPQPHLAARLDIRRIVEFRRREPAVLVEYQHPCSGKYIYAFIVLSVDGAIQLSKRVGFAFHHWLK